MKPLELFEAERGVILDYLLDDCQELLGKFRGGVSGVSEFSLRLWFV